MKKQERTPDNKIIISRRTFLKTSAVAGSGAAALLGGFPFQQTNIAEGEGSTNKMMLDLPQLESSAERLLAQGTGNIYYVDAVNGNDESCGGADYCPFKTISYAISQIASGDIICVRAGTYYEKVEIGMGKKGTADKPTILTNYPGEQPVIDGRAGTLSPGYPNDGLPDEDLKRFSRYGTNAHYQGLVKITGNHILFQGFKVTRSLGVGLHVGDGGKDIAVKGVTIRDCEFAYNRWVGLLLDNCKDVDGFGTIGCIVEGCDIYRNGAFGPYPRQGSEMNWPGALNIKECTKIVVRGTKIHENWAEGLIADARALGTRDVDIIGCEFYDNYRAHIYLHAVENVRVQRNLIYHTKNPEFPFSETYPSRGAGINIAPSEELVAEGKKKLSTKKVTIINNILVGNGWNLKFTRRTNETGTVSDVKVIHNTLVDAIKNGEDDEPVSVLDEDPPGDGGIVFKYNLILQSTGKSAYGESKKNVNPFDPEKWECSYNAWSPKPDFDSLKGAGDIYDGRVRLVNKDAPRSRGLVDPAWYALPESNSKKEEGEDPWSSTDKSVWADVDFFCRPRDGYHPDMGAHEFRVETSPWSTWERLTSPTDHFATFAVGRNMKYAWDNKTKELSPPRASHLALFGVAFDDSIWRSNQRVPGNWDQQWWGLYAGRNASLAVGENKDGRLSLFAVGKDGDVRHLEQKMPAIPPEPAGKDWYFNEWQFGAGSFPSSSDFVYVTVGKNVDGRLEVFGVKKDGTPWHTWQRESGWSPWEPFHSETQQFQRLVAALNDDGRQEVFGLGDYGAAWYTRQLTPNGGWSEWKRLHSPDDRFIDLAVGKNAAGHLEVFGVKKDNTPWHAWQRGEAWSPWAPFHSETQQFKSFAVGVSHDNRLEVFGLGTYGTAWHTWQRKPNGDWNPWVRFHTRCNRFEKLGVRRNIRVLKDKNKKVNYCINDGLEVIGLKKDGSLWRIWKKVGRWECAVESSYLPHLASP